MAAAFSGCSSNYFTPLPNSALYKAAQKGDLPAVQSIVAAGQPADGGKYDLMPPLSIALYNKHFSIARLLIDQGADVNRNHNLREGATPLQIVCMNQGVGAAEIVELLIRKGANTNFADKEGRTPLFVACRNPSGATMDIVKLLVAHGAAIDRRSEDGWYALFSVCRYNEAYCRLENARSGVVSNANDFWSVVDRSNPQGTLPKILQNGEDAVTARNLASIDQRMDSIKIHNGALLAYFIEKGADVNVVGSGGWTALHLACRYGDDEMVGSLIAAGAHLNVKTADGGWTPLRLAQEHGDDGMVRMLQANGAM